MLISSHGQSIHLASSSRSYRMKPIITRQTERTSFGVWSIGSMFYMAGCTPMYLMTMCFTTEIASPTFMQGSSSFVPPVTGFPEQCECDSMRASLGHSSKITSMPASHHFLTVPCFFFHSRQTSTLPHSLSETVSTSTPTWSQSCLEYLQAIY